MKDNTVNLNDVEFLPLGETESEKTITIVDDDSTNDDIDDIELDDTSLEGQDVNEDIDDTEIIDDSDTDDKADSLYKSLIDSSGVEFSEEELKDILETDEDEAGFTKVATSVANKIAESKFNGLLEKYPMAANLMKYEINGGNPEDYFETYFPPIDYSEVKVEENDVDLQKDIISENLKDQGFDDDEIADQLKDYESGGLLFKQASRSLKLLQNSQEQKKADFTKKQETVENERKEALKQEKTKVNELVSSGDIKGITIPDAKKGAFEDYLFKPVNEQGQSQAFIDNQKLTMEDRVLITYLQFTGMKLDELVKSQSKSTKVRSIRDSLKSDDKLKDKTNKNVSSYAKNTDIDKIESIF